MSHFGHTNEVRSPGGKERICAHLIGGSMCFLHEKLSRLTACTRMLVHTSASVGVTCYEFRGQPCVMHSIPPKRAVSTKYRMPACSFPPGSS